MYLDTDVILAAVKDDDWLASDVDLTSLSDPRTSVATCIEVQYAMEDEWNRADLARTSDVIADLGVDLVPLRVEHVRAGDDLRESYDRLNLFDAVHLGTARCLDAPLVSTDSLFPDIDEVATVDPRDLRE